MPKISSTFCPAKWDEVHVNLNYNYVYSCCKATPLKFVNNIDEVLGQQKENLLNGVQDSSCSYCWKNENAGQLSLRQEMLDGFDVTTYSQYEDNTIEPKLFEINLGNECNFQCTYCNPKFSSQWESDVKQKPYEVFSDRHFYAIDQKNSNTVENTIDWLTRVNSIETLLVMGGEPLLNKNFFRIIESPKSDYLSFTTNLSCKTTAPIDKIFKAAPNYKTIFLNISIDSTEDNAEFTRYGMNYELLLSNIRYVLTNAPTNVTITFLSLMTSVTIRDLTNTAKLMDTLYAINNNISWTLSICQFPMIMQLTTLPDEYKPEILQTLTEMLDKPYINYANLVMGNLQSSKFNNTLYQGLKHFLNEFSIRKNIAIPICLK